MNQKGNYPTRVLFNNIPGHFESVRTNTFSIVTSAISDGKVNPGIVMVIGQENLRTPFVNCSEQKIYLHENFVAFLWSVCYSLFVIYEEGVQKRIAANTFSGSIDYNTPILKDAAALFTWASKLSEGHTTWPTNLPNPERHKSKEEKWYSEKVNGIFLDALTFILFHEFGHLVNDHCEISQGYQDSDQNDLYKQIENEADVYAFESIVEESDDEKYKLYKGVAILLASVTRLFSINNPRLVSQQTHPDLDDRILHSITRLQLQDENSSDYLWYLGAFGCKLFFDEHKITTDLSTVEKPKALFFRYLANFDELK